MQSNTQRNMADHSVEYKVESLRDCRQLQGPSTGGRGPRNWQVRWAVSVFNLTEIQARMNESSDGKRASDLVWQLQPNKDPTKINVVWRDSWVGEHALACSGLIDTISQDFFNRT